MTPFLRGVLCGLVWMLAPAAGAQEAKPSAEAQATASTGTVEDRTETPCVTAEEEAPPRSQVIRRPSRPVVTLDAGRSTWPVETLRLETSGPTVDVGSMTTGVRVDQEFLERIAVRPAATESREASGSTRETSALEDALSGAPARRDTAEPELRLRRFRSLAELAPGTPEQVVLEDLEGHRDQEPEARIVSR